LDLDTGWRIGEEAFEWIVGTLRERDVKRILEFGSGASTIRFALALPDCQIVSVESDETFANATRSLAAVNGVESRVCVHLARLRSFRVQGWRFTSYDFSSNELFDAIVIDGPPGVAKRGREACLYIACGLLMHTGTVIVDDSTRPAEAAGLRRLEKCLQPASAVAVDRLDIGHGVTAIQVRGPFRLRFGLGWHLDICRESIGSMASAVGRSR